mgnify:FL=1
MKHINQKHQYKLHQGYIESHEMLNKIAKRMLKNEILTDDLLEMYNNTVNNRIKKIRKQYMGYKSEKVSNKWNNIYNKLKSLKKDQIEWKNSRNDTVNHIHLLLSIY